MTMPHLPAIPANLLPFQPALLAVTPWPVPALAERLGEQPGWLRAAPPPAGAAMPAVAAAWAGMPLLRR